MQNSSPAPENVETILGVVLRAAQMHGASVSIEDITQLLPGEATAADVESAIGGAPELSERYALKDGFIVQREDSIAGTPKDSRLKTYATNLRTAKWLSSRFHSDDVLAIAVSGSTSYKAASEKDDVDLFCVTREGGMWVFLAKALLFARVAKLLRKSDAPICLSCIMDLRYAKLLFDQDRGALFARDALVAEVVSGPDQYKSLLARSPWMSRYFPKFYSMRRGTSSMMGIASPKTSSLIDLANRFVFAVLGTYIRTKARFHNHLLARQSKGPAIFQARMGSDHLIYESTKYLALRQMYDEIRPAPEVADEKTVQGWVIETNSNAP